jgi:four helix bundle protein
MVILTRMYDLLKWIIPVTEKFPKSQRFITTQRLQEAVFDLQEMLLEANALSGPARFARLQQADGELSKIRLYLRLTHEWRWISTGQYEHVSKMIAEIGRLLGGWMKQSKG